MEYKCLSKTKALIRTDQGALRCTPWQTSSIEHRLYLSGKYSTTGELLHQDYSYTYIQHCL